MIVSRFTLSTESVVICRFWFGHVRCPRDRPSRDRPSRDRPSRDRPSREPPKNSLFFFFLLRRKIRSFLPSLGVFSWNFGGVFEGRDPQMCTFGLSGCCVKPQRLWGRRGFTRQPARNLGPPPFGAPTIRGPTLRGLTGVNSSMLYFHLVVLFFFFFKKAKTP